MRLRKILSDIVISLNFKEATQHVGRKPPSHQITNVTETSWPTLQTGGIN